VSHLHIERFREWVMTRTERLAAIGACILEFAVIFQPPFAATPAAAASGVPPFCVARGGGGEGAAPRQDCRYYDYQACLEAAVGGGNCVQNVDFHGEVSTAPAPVRARHRR
jgi:hypothetical protein